MAAVGERLRALPDQQPRTPDGRFVGGSPIPYVCVLALAAMCLAMLGCSEDLPDEAAARVGDVTIARPTLDAELIRPGPSGERIGLAERRAEALERLIEAEWLEQEAKRRGVTLSDEQVRRGFGDLTGTGRAGGALYDRAVARSGLGEEAFLRAVRTELLGRLLVRKLMHSARAHPSAATVVSYYRRNRRRLGEPERRVVSVIVTPRREEAVAARTQLRAGRNWRSVAARFSVDTAAQRPAGPRLSLTEGHGDRRLDEAAFAARRGRTVGPIETDFGWWLLRVERVRTERRPSLREARDEIRKELRIGLERRALAKLRARFRGHYRSITTCAEGLEMAHCANGPDPRTFGPLRIYRVDSQAGPELIIYVPSEALTPSIAPRSRSVDLDCNDERGRPIIRARLLWRRGEDGFALPHFHQATPGRDALRRVAECRITGPSRPLAGEPLNKRPLGGHPNDPPADPNAGFGPV